MTHDELRELAASYALGALSDEERRAFEPHLEVCPECVGDVASLQMTATELAFAVPARTAPASLRARVLAGIDAQPLRSAVLSQAPAVPVAVAQARPSGAPWWMAAAAILATILVGGYALALRAHVGILDQELEESRAQAQVARRQLIDAQAELSRAQIEVRRVNLTTGILAAPDVLKVDLKGQAKTAPRAIGRAYWSRSRGLLFTANSLPALPGNQVYQLWIVPKGGAPVSAGLLAPDAQGRALVVADQSSAVPGTVAVTVEPAGGVPAPTGPFALVGAL